MYTHGKEYVIITPSSERYIVQIVAMVANRSVGSKNADRLVWARRIIDELIDTDTVTFQAWHLRILRVVKMGLLERVVPSDPLMDTRSLLVKLTPAGQQFVERYNGSEHIQKISHLLDTAPPERTTPHHKK